MIKKILSTILSAIILVSTVSTNAYASTNPTLSKDEQLREAVFDVVYLFKEVIDSQYAGIEKDIENLIVEKGYDYSLSIDSFYEQPNPIKDADCIKYLAAYMSCKKYAQENSLNIPQLCDIPFISYKTSENTNEEYIPTKIEKYHQSEFVLDEYWKGEDEYILIPTEVPVYERQENGKFKKTGETKLIEPDTKEIKYIDIELSVISPEELFEYLKIDENLVSDDYERRAAMIKRVISNESIVQTLSVNFPALELLTGANLSEYVPYLEGLDDTRRVVVQTALSLINKVPYEWGGKAKAPGLDYSWWSYNPDNGLQHGLDCSGFVQWAFMTSGFSKETYGQIYSTKNLLSCGMKQVSKEELKPGDIGCTNRPNGKVNHTGIYLGNDLWIHCSSVKKTVTVSKVDFTVFFSPYENEESIDNEVVMAYARAIMPNSDTINNNDSISKFIDTYNSIYYTQSYNSDDTMLLAKLIYNEARGEGINGWIGVGEVVMNRIQSPLYPNTVKEVVYEQGQFSNSERLENITPTDEMVTVAQMILSGNLRVINNPEVLYFKNPQITDNVPSTTPMDWGTHRYYMAIGSHAFYLQ